MAFEGYVDLAIPALKTTRMNAKLDSLIDHILVNDSAKFHVEQDEATIFKTGVGEGNPDLFAA